LVQAVADTNLLVAVMVEDDRDHKQAIRIWELKRMSGLSRDFGVRFDAG
jgi:hypothetical protein